MPGLYSKFIFFYAINNCKFIFKYIDQLNGERFIWQKTLTLFSLKNLEENKTSKEFSEITHMNNFYTCNFSVMYLTHIVNLHIYTWGVRR